MSAPAYTSDTICRGADYSFSFRMRLHGPESDIADLTNWQWAGVLRNAAGASIADMAVTTPDAETVSFGLTYEETADLAAQTGAVLTINAITPDGIHMQLIRNRITIL